jgi:two-component system chemotaxis sensor kinase CheA
MNTLITPAKLEEHVLIVDDEPDVVEVLLECASKTPAKTFGTTNLTEAENFLRGNTVFLLLVDFRMPLEDGLSFFERMKAIQPSLNAALITAHADKTAALRSIKLGLTDLIEKPFKVGEIVSLINTHYTKKIAALEADAAAIRAIAEGFVQEAAEILDGVDALLLEFESSQGNERHIVDNLYRRVHTIKGCSRSIPGTESIFQIAHTWETLLSKYRDGSRAVCPDDIDNMLKASDALKKCIQSLLSESPFVPDTEQIVKSLSLQSPAQAVITNDDGIIWVEQPPSSASEPKTQPACAPQNTPQAQAHQNDTAATMTVSTQKIDSFMEITGELVVLRNSLQSVLETLICDGSVGARAVKPFAKELSDITARLQRDVLAMRRVRVDSVTRNLQRTVREVARGLNKEIRLEIDGGETEIDKNIAKHLSASLIHIVRNSCDHGIETPEERLAKGKSREGVIALQASTRNGVIEVRVKDDGRGLDRERILNKALEKGMLNPQNSAKLSDTEVFDFIFGAGFSTATKVSDVSGRGVGMDVVRNELNAVNGSVRIESVAGAGATFVLVIPEIQSVAVQKLIVFSLGQYKIALPMAAVSTVFRFTERSVVRHPSRAEIEFENQLQPLIRPHDLFHSLSESAPNHQRDTVRMGVLLSHKKHRLVLEVEDIDRQIDAVVRPLDGSTRNVPACNGIALLSDEALAYTLSPDRLVERVFAR